MCCYVDIQKTLCRICDTYVYVINNSLYECECASKLVVAIREEIKSSLRAMLVAILTENFHFIQFIFLLNVYSYVKKRR